MGEFSHPSRHTSGLTLQPPLLIWVCAKPRSGQRERLKGQQSSPPIRFLHCTTSQIKKSHSSSTLRTLLSETKMKLIAPLSPFARNLSHFCSCPKFHWSFHHLSTPPPKKKCISFPWCWLIHCSQITCIPFWGDFVQQTREMSTALFQWVLSWCHFSPEDKISQKKDTKVSVFVRELRNRVEIFQQLTKWKEKTEWFSLHLRPLIKRSVMGSSAPAARWSVLVQDTEPQSSQLLLPCCINGWA